MSLENTYLSGSQIRALFSQALSAQYQAEVHQYAALKTLVHKLNKAQLEKNRLNNFDHIEGETKLSHAINGSVFHGAIRLGKASELFNMRRLFAVMGMQAVDYYDLSSAGIPVHSTAFRAVSPEDMALDPFRMFCSLLRLDHIEDKALRAKAKSLLEQREIFTDDLLALIKRHESQGGLSQSQAQDFVRQALGVFRWNNKAQVDLATYEAFTSYSRILADIVCFKTPHINHLTLSSLDIDAVQMAMREKGFAAKAEIEGPPKREAPILLRQTSFMAVEEAVVFSDQTAGKHAARFGEIEQRGMALTPKGRALYDALLNEARGKGEKQAFQNQLATSFKRFPDASLALYEQKLVYFYFELGAPMSASKLKEIQATTPMQPIQPMQIRQLIKSGHLKISAICYEDFLPISAAGIFRSNLQNQAIAETEKNQNPDQAQFEKALGKSVLNSFSLYENLQKKSLESVLIKLGR